MSEVFKAKVNTALTRAEDPRELLDYSYTLQRDLLQKVRRAVVDVAAARTAVGDRQEQLRRSAARLQEQAEDVLGAGDEELAREALARRTRLLEQADELARRQRDLRAEEERLIAAAERLQAKIDAFATRKETLKARCTLAEAETYVDATAAGISEEMTDVDLAAQRAEEQTAQLHARAAALDELIESGALHDPFTSRPDLPAEFQARLAEALTSAAVDEELRTMKARLKDRDSDSRESPGERESRRDSAQPTGE
jgi:phage shock protein A